MVLGGAGSGADIVELDRPLYTSAFGET
jgi:hypothetical protein